MESAALDLLTVCPGCRTRSDRGLELQTLERVGDELVCSCGRRYPIIDGVPIVTADPAAYLAAGSTVVEDGLVPDLDRALQGPDEAAYPRLLEHLSIYLDAHWGDRATPPPQSGFSEALIERIAARGSHHVAAAIELGCSVGRIALELARGADRVVGIDLHLGAVRRARHLLAGETIPYARRIAGRHYAVATARGERIAPERLHLVCGDALDPPCVPEVFDRVVALNLLDSVPSPRQLLSVIDGLCRPGGEVILSSPYAWLGSTLPDHERIGGSDPATAVVEILRTGQGLRAPYTIEDQAEVPWTLRRDARSVVTYQLHYVRARKAQGT